MKIRMPSYYPAFRCAAGACPDTCCSCWEVIVDPETRKKYEALPGTLGERVREVLRVDENGESYLAFPDGRCPMLTEAGLCSLQKEYGEEMLSRVCDRYPRFRYEFGAFAELGVSLSCPAACRLILDTPFVLTETENSDPPSMNDIRPERYIAFSRGRKLAFAIAEDRRFRVFERTALLLSFAEELERSVTDPQEVLSAWSADSLPDRLAALRPNKCGRFSSLLRAFKTMDWLTQRFPAMLDRLTEASPLPDEIQAERLLQYFLYKYFLQAAYDGKLLKKVQFASAMLLLLGALFRSEEPQNAEDVTDLFHLCSRELEHSEENLSVFFSWAGKRRQTLLIRLLFS